MANHFLITPEFQREITRRNPSAAEWLNTLPATFSELCGRWGMSPNGAPSFGRTGIAVPVTGTFGDAIIKLVSPASDIESEARALTLLNKAAVVPLLNESIPDRALLLTRLKGTLADANMSLAESATIAGEIAASIATTPAPDDVPTLASGANGWLHGFREQHERALAAGMQVPTNQFEAAQEAIRSLASDDSASMTHGDLSLDNIMQSSTGAWLAIDPLLLAGTVGNEAHTVVRSMLPIILESEQPGQLLHQLTHRFCDAAGTEYETAQRISLARYVASYYWEAQNDGDPANVARLKHAASLTLELLS